MDEIDETFGGLQAQVASLRRRVFVEHRQRLCHISDINTANVVGLHLKPLACVETKVRFLRIALQCKVLQGLQAL